MTEVRERTAGTSPEVGRRPGRWRALALLAVVVAQIRSRPAGLLTRTDDVPLGYDFAWTRGPLAAVGDVVTRHLEGTS